MNAPFKPETAQRDFVAEANRKAAQIAAREVRAYILRTGSDEHRQSLADWEDGLRSWPWPDPTPAETEAADAAVRDLFGVDEPQVLTERVWVSL
jgi:hypothetical protein